MIHSGGPMGPHMHSPGMGGLRRSMDLTDEQVFGKVYDNKVVGRLAGYIGNYRGQFVLAVVSMIAFTLTNVAMPWLVSIAIDNYVSQGNLDGLTAILAIFIVNGLISWGAQYWQMISMAKVGLGILLTLRKEMFEHLQKLSLSFYNRNEVGRIMSRVQNDVMALQELVTNGVIHIIADILTLMGIMVVLFFMNPKLAIVSLAVVPVLVITMTIWQSHAKNSFMKVRQTISVVNAELQENISGIRVTQSFARENLNLQKFDNLNDANLNANMKAGLLTAMLQPIVELLVSSAIALVIWFGGSQALEGNLGPGVLIAFVLYVQRFFEPIRRLSGQFTELQRAMAGGQRIFEVLDTKIEVTDRADALEIPLIKGLVIFENVSFQYRDRINVLNDINLTVSPGETIALVGPTGAGKSTLISLICRFYDVSEGKITIDGVDVRNIRQESLRRQIGLVLQDPLLFSGTITENIRYGRPDTKETDVIAAARETGAHNFISRLENKYDTIVLERGVNLSVGQRQLISLTRAILIQPRILILDEATANIDSQTEVTIQAALKKILKERTSFVIAHRLSTIRDASRIVVLESGRISEIGNHQELMYRNGPYRHLYNMNYKSASLPGI